MLKKILLGLAGLVVILLIVIAAQPAEYRVSRTALLAAPPTALFEHVNDQRKFNQWNPWLKLDPNTKVEYTGATAWKSLKGSKGSCLKRWGCRQNKAASTMSKV